MFEQSINYFYDTLCPSVNRVNNKIDDLGLQKNVEILYNRIDTSLNSNVGVEDVIRIIDTMIDVCSREKYLEDRKIFVPSIQDDVNSMVMNLELFKNMILVEYRSIKEEEPVKVKDRYDNGVIITKNGIDTIYTDKVANKERLPNINKY